MNALRKLSWLPVALLLGLTACGGREAASEAPKKTIEDRFPIRIGDRTVRLQVAVLADEQQKGLMHRKSLEPDEGMLFVFARPQQMGFWMRNTLIPLDIGYIDPAGELKEIYPMYPLDERPVSSHSRHIQFCLEMNQGWFRQNGVKPGARLDLAAVADAVRARGLKPEAYGLH